MIFPVSRERIEKYVQILLPAYKFNLIMEQNSATIGDVLPALFIMISQWKRFDVTCSYKRLCLLLVSAFQKKFDFEIKSNV